MLKYFTDKLTKLDTDIKYSTRKLIEYASSGTIAEIQSCIAAIKENKQFQEMFARGRC